MGRVAKAIAGAGLAACSLLVLGASSCTSASGGPTMVTFPAVDPADVDIPPLLVPPLGDANADTTSEPDAVPPASTGADAATDAVTNGGPADASTSKASAAPSTCKWPASLNDAGPGACRVGRAYVECKYPSGVSCDGGLGASSPGGLTMLCISDDPTSCQGCDSISGPATCTNMCAPNEYAVSCGGPPLFSGDGGFDNFAYQQPPANCVGVAGTPAGNEYSCCPCE